MTTHSGHEVAGRLLRSAGVTLAVLAALTPARGAAHADEAPADGYARVEVRGVLQKAEEAPRPGQGGYHIVVGQGKEARRYQLVLADDEKGRRLADSLVGKVVVAAGELTIKEETSFKSRAGRRYLFGEVKVKTLAKAEAGRE